MIINDRKRIKYVQEEFQEKFPFLKLEFYRKQHAVGEGNSDKERLDEKQTIGAVRVIHRSGDLAIDGMMTVFTLEQEFHKTYGLNVQVFRKSGGIWLQTTTTDDWTLKRQNEEGSTSSSVHS